LSIFVNGTVRERYTYDVDTYVPLNSNVNDETCYVASITPVWIYCHGCIALLARILLTSRRLQSRSDNRVHACAACPS
jgi:hypothetical protein